MPGRSTAAFLKVVATTILGAAGVVLSLMTIVGSAAGVPSYVAGLLLGFLLAVFSALPPLALGYHWARLALAGFLWASFAVQAWSFSAAPAGGGREWAVRVAFAVITAAGVVNLHGQSVRDWVTSAGALRRQRFPRESGWGLASGLLAVFAGAGVWTQLGRDVWLLLGAQGSAPRLEQKLFGAVGALLVLFGLATFKHSRFRLYLVLALDLVVVLGHVALDFRRGGDQLAFDLTLAVLILSAYFTASRAEPTC